MTRSLLAPYAFSAANVIRVAVAQKITPGLEEAIRRVRECVLPHEDQRMREFTGGRTGSGIGKLLIIEREAPFLGRKLALLLVREKLCERRTTHRTVSCSTCPTPALD